MSVAPTHATRPPNNAFHLTSWLAFALASSQVNAGVRLHILHDTGLE